MNAPEKQGENEKIPIRAGGVITRTRHLRSPMIVAGVLSSAIVELAVEEVKTKAEMLKAKKLK